MAKIDFSEFKSMMLYDISKNQSCIEVKFCVDMSDIYKKSWLGKMLDKDSHEPIYWYGLVEDGSQAYDYKSFEQFSDAKVFNGKSIKEIWDSISILGIDACDVEDRLPFYLELV
jgi:hypothetical protein